jgi:hypothetical protein
MTHWISTKTNRLQEEIFEIKTPKYASDASELRNTPKKASQELSYTPSISASYHF